VGERRPEAFGDPLPCFLTQTKTSNGGPNEHGGFILGGYGTVSSMDVHVGAEEVTDVLVGLIDPRAVKPQMRGEVTREAWPSYAVAQTGSQCEITPNTQIISIPRTRSYEVPRNALSRSAMHVRRSARNCW
jgi:hypothetical protein